MEQGQWPLLSTVTKTPVCHQSVVGLWAVMTTQMTLYSHGFDRSCFTVLFAVSPEIRAVVLPALVGK